MEALVEPPSTRIRRGSLLWPILTFIFFFIAVVMTAICLWTVLKPEHECKSRESPSNLRNLYSPCPNHPPLLALPSPLPQQVKNALDTIESHLIDLVQTPEKGANMSAMSIKIIYQNTTLLNGHYGSKVFKGSTAPDDHTIYRIGSVTKIFAVLLLFKLYEDGVITSLDDPLVKYAPNFAIKSPFGLSYKITLRQIAGQMSGLPREAPCGYRCKNTTTHEQLSLLKTQYLVVKPWTIPSYSNLGYALLGRILTENLLNVTFEKWIQDNLLDPLEMKDTGLVLTDKVKEKMAMPYFGNGTVMPFMNLGWAGPAGEMYSTVSDLIKLAHIFLHPEQQSIFKPETLREMLLPDFLTNDGFWMWGSPFEIRFTNHFVAREKGGNVETYNALFSVIPELKMAMSVTVNYSPALKFQSYNCFKVAEVVHDTLLPVLNQTLFDIKSKSPFPLPLKPFLGRFLLTQVSMLTGKSGTYNVTIEENEGVLEILPHNPALFERGITLQYIGQPLLFQGLSKLASNSPCATAHFGMYGTVQFEPPGPDGLSKGFVGKSWKIQGVRIEAKKNGMSEIVKEDHEESLDSMFYNTLS